MLHGTVSVSSQPHVLKEKMHQAGFTHGREARVNLRGIRVAGRDGGEGVVYFCNMQRIEVLEVLQEGDQAALPDGLTVEALTFPTEGRYDLVGAILSSNGRLHVRADEATRIAPWRAVQRDAAGSVPRAGWWQHLSRLVQEQE